jgi:hypothetical protein
MRAVRCLVGAALLLPLLAGCPGQTDPATPDGTSPTLGLDAFGIPLQPGASSQPNPESVDVSCCDLTRVVRPGQVDLLAGAKDAESGVRSVSIWVVANSTSCVFADGSATNTPGLVGIPATQNPPTPPTGTPTSAPNQLIAQYDLAVPGRPASCVRYDASWTIYARAEDYAGHQAQTKQFTFRLTL